MLGSTSIAVTVLSRLCAKPMTERNIKDNSRVVFFIYERLGYYKDKQSVAKNILKICTISQLGHKNCFTLPPPENCDLLGQKIKL